MENRGKLKELDIFITSINGEPVLFKHANTYESRAWMTADKCTTYYPVQRKLGARECIFDLDHVSPGAMRQIPRWLESIDFKFQAWQTSDDGMHIHFWTDIEGKDKKKLLVQEMSKKVEEMFGVKNDSGPMQHNHIRTEWSKHPEKGTMKTLLSSNLSILFYLNDVDPSTREKVLKMKASEPSKEKSNSGPKAGKCPTCMKYILSHKFSDGKKRLMFAVASWYKSQGMTSKETAKATWDWVQGQGDPMPYSKVWVTANSTNGGVGCNYRHDILEELGVDMSQCKYE